MRRIAWVAVLVGVLTSGRARGDGDPFGAALSPDAPTRAAAMDGLAALQTIPAHKLLAHMLVADRDAAVRAAAATAIGRSRNAGLLDALKAAAAYDPDPGVRAAAGDAAEALWPWTRSVKLATGLSLIPGAGHFYLGRNGAGAAYLASTVALAGTGIALINDAPKGAPIGEPDDPALDGNDPIGFGLVMGAQNLWMYSIFDAYRSARLMREDDGYRFPISRESLGELVVAPFNPGVLKSPWVWAGIPVMLGLAVGYTAIVSSDDLSSPRSVFDGEGVNFLGKRYGTGPGIALGGLYLGGLFLPVGVGEEALFRGVIQGSLMESFGPWGGFVVGSLIFGGVHTFNFVNSEEQDVKTAALAVPFITAVGSYLGYVYMRSEQQLARSVALHFWYDFLLSGVGFLADPDHAPFVARFGMPW